MRIIKIVLLLTLVCVLPTLYGQSRLTDEEIEELREEENLPKLFEMPFANRRRIYALFIKPVDTGRGIVLRFGYGRNVGVLIRSCWQGKTGIHRM